MPYKNLNNCDVFLYFLLMKCVVDINHTLLSTIRTVISTLFCVSMASNSTSDNECY